MNSIYEIWKDVLKDDASEIGKAHKLWLSKLPPQYCDIHKEEKLILKAEESIDRVKSVNFNFRYGPPTPELASNNWRFYFIGVCPECNWLAKASDIPRLARDFSFDNFECDQEDLKDIVDRAKSFAQNPHGFLLMQGGCGTGKTHLAVSVLRETSLPFNYVSHSNLIQEYRNYHYKKPNADIDGYEEILSRSEGGYIKVKKTGRYEILQRSPLLCIDEFGFVNHSQDESSTTYSILDYRVQELLPTILLANYTTEKLKEIIDPRLLDRIDQALYANLQLGLPSRRKSMNTQYLEKASRQEH